MPTQGAPLNRREQFVDQGGFVREHAYQFLKGLREDQDETPQLETAVVEVDGQTAAIGTTAIPSATLSAGYYRVSTFLRVTTAAATSGDVRVTIHYIRDGVACSEAGTLLNANLTNVPQSDVFLIFIDGSSPVSYSVAYNSNGANELTYELSLILERVSA